MLPALEKTSSIPLVTAAQDILYCRDKLADLDKVAQKDASLKEGLKAGTDLSVGFNLSIEHRQPVLAAISWPNAPSPLRRQIVKNPLKPRRG